MEATILRFSKSKNIVLSIAGIMKYLRNLSIRCTLLRVSRNLMEKITDAMDAAATMIGPCVVTIDSQPSKMISEASPLSSKTKMDPKKA